MVEHVGQSCWNPTVIFGRDDDVTISLCNFLVGFLHPFWCIRWFCVEMKGFLERSQREFLRIWNCNVYKIFVATCMHLRQMFYHWPGSEKETNKCIALTKNDGFHPLGLYDIFNMYPNPLSQSAFTGGTEENYYF